MKKQKKIEYLPFVSAVEFVRKLKLKSLREWKQWAASDARPAYIPERPNLIYKEWTNFDNWLGITSTVKVVNSLPKRFIYLYNDTHSAQNIIYVGYYQSIGPIDWNDLGMATRRKIIKIYEYSSELEQLLCNLMGREIKELYNDPFLVKNLASFYFQLDINFKQI